ncbi:MAG: ketopantoate reductase family protein, partial [Nocardioidaceae bacterium]
VEANGVPLSGVLQIGTYPHGNDATDAQLVADLLASGFAATARDDVMAWKRAKLMRNVGNALEVLCGGGRNQRGKPEEYDDAVREVSRRAAHEARACFAAAQMSVTSDEDYEASPADQAQSVPIAGRPRQGGSTWQSVQRGQGSVETDFLNGEIVRLGRLHQVATPTNEAIQSRMRTVVRAGTHPQPINPAELLT